MTLSQLKWVAIFGPLLVLSGMWVLIHTELYHLHHFPEVLILIVVAAGGIAAFSFSMFALVRRLEAQILEQNDQLERRNQELTVLLDENARLHARILEGAVVEERVRIARELHDGLAQVLTYITTQTLAVKKLVADGKTGDAQRQLSAMAEAVKTVYADVREEILGLRATSNGPAHLVPMLRRYLDDYARLTGLAVDLQADGEAESLELAGPVEIQVLRIAQEALRNVRKHAQAEHATVRIGVDDGRLALEVADDGRGFEPNAVAGGTGWPRFGLRTMQERAAAIGGHFEIRSSRGAGTTVSIQIPRTAEVADARPAR